MATHSAEARALEWLRDSIAGVDCAFVRSGSFDGYSPRSRDADVMVFSDIPAFYPERRWAPDAVPVDIAWYPRGLLADPAQLAQSGLAAHRFQASELAWDLTGDAFAHQQAVKPYLYQPEIQVNRLAVFFDLGYLTVREIGVTWDFPALALFWLSMAHAACVAALSDVLRRPSPNAFTRPFEYLDGIERETGFEPSRKSPS